MCCGDKRVLNRNATAAVAPVQRQVVVTPPAAHVVVAPQAAAQRRAVVAPRAAQAGAAPVGVLFEYTGKTRLTVISPLTGVRYHFAAPGAQAPVDRRDQGMMAGVAGLRPVRSSRA